jgi:hypothetical protein
VFAEQMRAAIKAAPPASQLALRRNPSAWAPSTPAGPYKLPRDVQDRLTTALRDFRNREAAAALAAFLGRFWSTPARLAVAFPIDRRALTDHPALGLTEARVRGAILTLKAIGFLDPDALKGSGYRATAAGLHRKPVLFRFGAGYREAFAKANSSSRAARGGTPPARRPITAHMAASRPALPLPQVAQRQKLSQREVLMGDHKAPMETNLGLEAALSRLLEGVFGREGGRSTEEPCQQLGASPIREAM